MGFLLKDKNILFFRLLPCLWLIACQTEKSIDFTSEERGQLIEAPDIFEKKIFNISNVGPLFWINDDTIIFTKYELPPPQSTESRPLPRIVTLNIKTGDLENTPHLGDLLCYANGNIALHIKNNQLPHSSDEDYFGRYGEVLEKIGGGSFPVILFDTCRRRIGSDTPLYYFSESIRRTSKFNANALDGIEITNQSENIISKFQMPNSLVTFSQNNFIYVPYANKYLYRGIIPGVKFNNKNISGLWLSQNGNIEFIESNSFLQNLAENNIGSGRVIPTKQGIFWSFTPWFSHWKMQGLYFQQQDKLFRLDKNSISKPSTSPSGCLMAYSHILGNPATFRASNMIEREQLVIMNVCHGR